MGTKDAEAHTTRASSLDLNEQPNGQRRIDPSGASMADPPSPQTERCSFILIFLEGAFVWRENDDDKMIWVMRMVRAFWMEDDGAAVEGHLSYAAPTSFSIIVSVIIIVILIVIILHNHHHHCPPSQAPS